MNKSKIKAWFILAKAVLLMMILLPPIILGFKTISRKGIHKARSILHELVDLGAITQEEYDEAFAKGEQWSKR